MPNTYAINSYRFKDRVHFHENLNDRFIYLYLGKEFTVIENLTIDLRQD